jgi:hypothetical protein
MVWVQGSRGTRTVGMKYAARWRPSASASHARPTATRSAYAAGAAKSRGEVRSYDPGIRKAVPRKFLGSLEYCGAGRPPPQKLDCRLLLGEAVKCAQPPDQFAAIDPDDAATWKKVAQDR